MPERLNPGIIYYRGKAEAIGALLIGFVLLGCGIIAVTTGEIGGFRFSRDLAMMSTYLALPLGVVLILANIRHIVARGATVTAGKDGITILYTDRPVGPLRWAVITALKPLRHQGKLHLGISLEDPAGTLYPWRDVVAPLMWKPGKKTVHMKVDGKMLDDNIRRIVAELDEMRQIYSWRP